MSQKKIKIAEAKGRPMLSWVGKRALTHVPAFPAQHIESFDAAGGSGPEHEDGDWSDWPDRYPRGGVLFHGDNKEVLAHLLASGFRGRVKLIYIDPPFDSGADYVRRVQLRGAGTAKIDGEAYSLGEQIQYTDIWANDTYLQFMYERLLLLKELLAEDATIAVHVDPKRSHQVRMLLDEVFGMDAFRNEIVWWYWNKMQGNVQRFAANHDTILIYEKGHPPFNKIEEERESVVRQLKRVWDKSSQSLVNAKDEEGNLIYLERSERTMDDVWRISMLQPADDTENLRFPTQKPEDLLSIVVASATNPNDLVLDCFLGSGTTAAVAQKLGRRWIGCDINKGAIQTASKRLQAVLQEQAESPAGSPQGELEVEDGEGAEPGPAQLSFGVWRVNDYDLQVQHNEAVELACEHIGVERSRADGFFDGVLGKALVKIVPFTHPLSPADLDEVRRELEARPEEDRHIVMVCLGKETAADAWIDDWNALRKGKTSANRIEVIELRTDPKYGKFIQHKPAEATVRVERGDGKVRVAVEDFVSPTIIERLEMDVPLFRAKIPDWRAMVDCVMIDPDFDGDVFRVALSDVPARKDDLVSGTYEIEAPAGGAGVVAVKVIDMLGEEVLVVDRP